MQQKTHTCLLPTFKNKENHYGRLQTYIIGAWHYVDRVYTGEPTLMYSQHAKEQEFIPSILICMISKKY